MLFANTFEPLQAVDEEPTGEQPPTTTSTTQQVESTLPAVYPVSAGSVVYLPVVMQEQDMVNAAWFGFFSGVLSTNANYSLTIEKRNFDAGGDGPASFLQLPILLDLYGYLTIQNYDALKVWGIRNAQLDQAQAVTKGTGVTIAVLDTGITAFSWELGKRLTNGYDFVDNDPYPLEEANLWDDDWDWLVDEGVGHGTFVSSIIAATTRDTKIMPVRILNSDGNGTADVVAKGVRYATDRGAQIINLSLSGATDDPTLRAAIQYATDHGVLLIAAAASNRPQLGYPAAYPAVISVGAIDQANTIAEFARANAPLTSVFAPGQEIYGLSNLGYGVWMSGNSMAAAFVSATAALLLQGNRCPAVCVRAALTRQVNPITPAQNDRGRIDAYRALQAIPTP